MHETYRTLPRNQELKPQSVLGPNNRQRDHYIFSPSNHMAIKVTKQDESQITTNNVYPGRPGRVYSTTPKSHKSQYLGLTTPKEFNERSGSPAEQISSINVEIQLSPNKHEIFNKIYLNPSNNE